MHPLKTSDDSHAVWTENRGQVNAPGIFVSSLEELADAVETKSYLSKESLAKLASFREIFGEFDDGHAAERVVRKVFHNEDPPRTNSTRKLPSTFGR